MHVSVVQSRPVSTVPTQSHTARTQIHPCTWWRGIGFRTKDSVARRTLGKYFRTFQRSHLLECKLHVFRLNALQAPNWADECPPPFPLFLSHSGRTSSQLFGAFPCAVMVMETHKWTATGGRAHTHTCTLCQTFPWMSWTWMAFDLARLQTNWLQLFIDVP